ncbi:hypothetical protein NA78x_001721 [Anatilimnocola sp. NA78]|uniref:hypothetical protein n=1 Tax=Anatilimnocola sp. NA78 TaxID=3415683 RepID=UPI003CE493F0
MANRKDIEAGKAHVTLYAKLDPLLKGLKSTEGYMTDWGKRIVTIGAGITAAGISIIGAFAGAATVFANTGSGLNNMSQRTGVAATSLAELSYAANLSGTDIEAVEKALISMAKKGFNPRLFDRYAAEIAAMPDGFQKTQRAVEVFGKTGPALFPMIKNLQQLRKEARDLGVVPSQESIRTAAELGDLFDRLKKVGLAAVFEIGAAIAPVLIPVFDYIKEVMAGFNKWAKKNGETIRGVALLGIALVALGTAVTAVGVALIGLGAVAAATTAIIGFVAAITPVGWIIIGITAAVLALGAAFIALTYSLKDVLGSWGMWNIVAERVNRLGFAVKIVSKEIGKLFDPLKAALRSGELELAAEITATAIQRFFVGAIAEILKEISKIPHAFTQMVLPIGGPIILDALENIAGVGLDVGVKALDAKLEMLKRKAGKVSPQPGTPEYYSQQAAADPMKSLGSFNASQLRMQSWGIGGGVKKDPQEKIADWLKKIHEAIVMENRDLKRAIKDNNFVYGVA